MITNGNRKITILLVKLLVVLIFIFIGHASQVFGKEIDQPYQINPDNNYPLIITNQGQYHPDARYLFHHDNGGIWLAENALWFTYGDYQQSINELYNRSGVKSLQGREQPIRGVNIKVTFPGSNPNPRLVPFNPINTHVSYLIGSDRSDWFRDVQVWGGVRYVDLYPGIDLIIGRFEQDGSGFINPWCFEVRGKGDPTRIKMKIDGVQRLIKNESAITLETMVGDRILPLPNLVFSESFDNSFSLESLTSSDDPPNFFSRFVVSEPYTLKLTAHNIEENAGSSEDLIYSTYLGGNNWEFGYGIAIDESGAAFVVGRTPSTNFPTTPGAYDTTVSEVDVFVAKINHDGSALEYATFIGGSSTDSGNDIVVEEGIAYIAGDTASSDFPLAGESFNGEIDAFAAALNATGTDLIYATLFGGSNQDYGNSIDVSSGIAYLSGGTWSNDLVDYSGNGDVFVVKFSPIGSINDYTLFGGSLEDAGFAIDEEGNNLYLTGETFSPDFDATPPYNGNGDAFLVKMDSDLNVVYGKFLGGTSRDTGSDITVQPDGVSYITGITGSTNFPATIGSYAGSDDAFIAKFNTSGSLLSSAYLGGSANDEGRGVAIDLVGNLFIGGLTSSSDFPISTDAYQIDIGGGYDSFLVQMDLSQLDPILYASFIGGSEDDKCYSLAVDGNAYSYLTGYTRSSNFPVSIGAFDTSLGGVRDAFITKLAAGPIPRLNIQKSTNGFDADELPGPTILVDTTVDWTYIVTNTGRVTITEVTVTDSEGITLDCPGQTSLAVGESLICTASGVTVSGQYTNTGQVTGTPPAGLPMLVNTDPSHYFGALPGITVTKVTNGQNGSYILVGTPVTWTYTVTATGNVPVGGIELTDSETGVIPIYQTGDQNEDQILDLDETWVYTATATAMTGAYSNTILATGVYTDDFDNTAYPQAEGSSSYFGAFPAIDIQKTTNGSSDPFILVGDPVTWIYTITNTGNVPVASIGLDDSDPFVFPIYLNGDTNQNSLLDLTETWIYTATGTANIGEYSNTGIVSGDYTDDHGSYADVYDTDTSSYYGVEPGILIQKFTNGVDADTPPGLLIAAGQGITWTFIVTNTGNVTLTNVTIDDDAFPTLNCSAESLAPDESTTCEVAGFAQPDQNSNTATVNGTPPVGQDVTDSDSSYYFGAVPGIEFLKFTNGEDAPTIPGPLILMSDTVQWTYLVTNTGNITLTVISVLDDIEGPIECSQSILLPDESTLCSKDSTAVEGQYENNATATGIPFISQVVTDTNSSHYFGVKPGVILVKSTNGQDADSIPGPYILVGDTVTWTYTITNSGNAILTGISLTDDNLDSIECPSSELNPGQAITCTQIGTAETGQYTNTATVTAQPPVGPPVQAVDSSHYFGAETSISLEKFTNGQDADSAPGPEILVGDLVTWTFWITNTGNVTLTQITVNDDREGSVICSQTELAPDEGTTCEATGDAIAGVYTNNAIATGKPPGELPVVSDSDPSHYFGIGPGIAVLKKTNGLDAKIEPGPYILAGDAVTWTYLITNTGNVTLTGITLSDDNPDIVHSCPSGFDLLVDESVICTATGTAISNQQTNTATVTGAPPFGEVITATDISHYFGVTPGLEIQKHTNGEDADTPTGPEILLGDLVTWTYTVNNTSNVNLFDIIVTDSDESLLVDCPRDTLTLAEPTMTCTTQIGEAVAGQYSNIGTTAGKSPDGRVLLTSTDPSHYFGANPQIDIEVHTNEFDADTPPGPTIQVGDKVIWHYFVSNTGNVELAEITVTDDQVAGISCPKTTLSPMEIMECQAIGTAVEGLFENLGEVRGTYLIDVEVTDSDPSHYTGVPRSKFYFPLIMRFTSIPKYRYYFPLMGK